MENEIRQSKSTERFRAVLFSVGEESAVGLVVGSRGARTCFFALPSSLKKVVVGRMMPESVSGRDVLTCFVIAMSFELGACKLAPRDAGKGEGQIADSWVATFLKTQLHANCHYQSSKLLAQSYEEAAKRALSHIPYPSWNSFPRSLSSQAAMSSLASTFAASQRAPMVVCMSEGMAISLDWKIGSSWG